MDKSIDAVQTGESPRVNGKVRVLILVTVMVALGLSIYGEVLWELISRVLHREDASHGICVPFITAYLVWFRYDEVKEATPKFALLPSMAMLMAGFILFSLTLNSAEVFLPALSFFLVVAGLVMGLYGKEVFKALGFPTLFLVTMIPLPKPLLAQLTEWMRMATTWGSVGLVQLFHFPIYREGYNVTIPTTTLFVGSSCSGIRYLIPYFVFGLAYAFVCKKTMRGRILLVLSTIPIAIMAGVLRQSLIFLSATYIGPFMAGHRPHILISWLVFLTVLAGGMWADRWVSSKLKAQNERSREGKEKFALG